MEDFAFYIFTLLVTFVQNDKDASVQHLDIQMLSMCVQLVDVWVFCWQSRLALLPSVPRLPYETFSCWDDWTYCNSYLNDEQLLPILAVDGTIIISKIAVLCTNLRAQAVQLNAI